PAARPARADDADPLAIVSPPHGIRHDKHAAGRRSAQSQESRLLLGVTQIRAIEGIRIGEHGRRLLERDSMLGAVGRSLPRVPLEHSSVYTKSGGGAIRSWIPRIASPAFVGWALMKPPRDALGEHGRRRSATGGSRPGRGVARAGRAAP